MSFTILVIWLSPLAPSLYSEELLFEINTCKIPKDLDFAGAFFRFECADDFLCGTLASALDSGYSPATIVVDAPIEINTPQGVWRPQNASHKFYGPTPLRTGIEQSRNLMTIRLAQEVGMDVVGSYAERFGVYDDLAPLLSNALGSQETTLYQMVSAYAMFANGGERVQPTLHFAYIQTWI